LPRPVQFYLFATVLLLAGAAISVPAHAEMTEADKQGMRAFTACLDEPGGDEAGCIEELGRYAWYPRDDATCKAVGARVDRIIGLGGDPVWRDLFQNERCARLGMPHGAAGLPIQPGSEAAGVFTACEDKWGWGICVEMFGRHEYFEVDSKDSCKSSTYLFNKPNADIEIKWWRRLLKNERCWRLGEAYFDTSTVRPPGR
jgi:hypothetical protein